MKRPTKFINIVNTYPHPIPYKESEDFFLLANVVMKEKGLDAEFVTLRNQKTIEAQFGNYSARTEFDKKGFKITRFDSTLQLLKYVRKQDAVVQANLRPFPPSTFAALLPNLKVMRSFTYVMGSNLPIALFSAAMFRRFDRILTVTPYESQVYRKWKIPEKKIRHLPLAIDYDFFSKKVSTAEVCKKYSIKDKDKIIIAAANIRKNKRFDVLLRALAEVKKAIPNAKVIAAGEDMLHAQELPSMTEMADKFGVKDSLILPGSQPPEELRKLYSASDVFVHPAENEYQGLVSYEAAASGLPLCLSSIGSHTSVYGENALYHHYEDYKKLAENIITSINKLDTREKHVKFLKKHMKNWDYPVMYKKTGEMYEELLA